MDGCVSLALVAVIPFLVVCFAWVYFYISLAIVCMFPHEGVVHLIPVIVTQPVLTIEHFAGESLCLACICLQPPNTKTNKCGFFVCCPSTLATFR